MKYKIDHDYHIHSELSLCARDKRQTTQFILQKALRLGFERICLTDHFWDETVPMASAFDFYQKQNYEHLSKALPLPQHEKVKFYFGCEADMDKCMNIGITKETADKFDFVIVTTTHLHMMDFTIDPEDDALERRAVRYVERFDTFLNKDLPFEKMGIAHLTYHNIAPAKFEDHIRLLDMISDAEFIRLFSQAAEKRLGIELNFNPFKYDAEQIEHILRPYRLAKKCGCKFYFGSDAHGPEYYVKLRQRFEMIVEMLYLEEENKFSFQ